MPGSYFVAHGLDTYSVYVVILESLTSTFCFMRLPQTPKWALLLIILAL